MFDCTCNTQNSLLLNQHNGDDAPQDWEHSSAVFKKISTAGSSLALHAGEWPVMYLKLRLQTLRRLETSQTSPSGRPVSLSVARVVPLG